MHGRAKFLGFGTMLAIAACGGEQGKLTIRSVGTPLSPQVKSVSSRVADGRSQFALGNVALALESFRKAVREEPGSIDAMTGLAACYDRMGRYDLSRKHYEAALAVEPANQHVLAALAASLDLQGRAQEAGAVRNEMHQRLAVARAAPVPADRFGAATVPLPIAEPAMTSTLHSGHREPVRISLAPTGIAAAVAPFPVIPPKASQPAKARLPITPAPNRVATIVSSTPGPSVTIKLPPPRPVDAPAAQATAPAVSKAAVERLARAPTPMPVAPPQPIAAAAVGLPVPVRAPKPTVARPIVATKVETGPRLQRTSMAEVTLLTRLGEPMWRPQVVQRTAQSSTIRFVPLREAGANIRIRVLNAARVDRLAARTRILMARRGWKNVGIGNALAVRTRSVVLYPSNARLTAQRLAAQLGFVSALRASSREVTVLLGRDAAVLARKRATT